MFGLEGQIGRARSLGAGGVGMVNAEHGLLWCVRNVQVGWKKVGISPLLFCPFGWSARQAVPLRVAQSYRLFIRLQVYSFPLEKKVGV